MVRVARQTKEELIERYNNKKMSQPKQSHYWRKRLMYEYNWDVVNSKPIDPPKQIDPEPVKQPDPVKDIVIEKKLTDWQDIINFDKPCRIGIFGLQGTGKTTLAKEIMREYFKYAFAFDIVGEYENFNRYKTKYRSYPDTAQEFDKFFQNYYKKNVIDKKIKSVLVLDEASRIAPTKRSLSDSVAELNDLHRHYDTSFIVVARRPVQLHTDLFELLNYIICFKLVGDNDMDKLNSLNKGLGDAVKQLEQFQCVIYDTTKDQIHYSTTSN